MTALPETGREIPADPMARIRREVDRVNEDSADMLDAWHAERGMETSRAHWKRRALAAEARLASLEAERAGTRREAMLEAAESAKAWRVVPDDFIVPGAMTAEDLVVARRTAKGIEDHLRELASEKGGQADG